MTREPIGSELRFSYNYTTHILSMEVEKPGTVRDGHGFICAARLLPSERRERDAYQPFRLDCAPPGPIGPLVPIGP
jgi:hypothetical protein